VWTGTSAKEIGLVDALGDLDTAVMIAKDKASIPEDEEVQFVYYPKKKTLADLIVEGEFLERIALLFWERVPRQVRDAAELSKIEYLYEDEPILLLAPDQITIE
jgi:protease-4